MKRLEGWVFKTVEYPRFCLPLKTLINFPISLLLNRKFIVKQFLFRKLTCKHSYATTQIYHAFVIRDCLSQRDKVPCLIRSCF